jgi:hypothetical protein
MYIDDCGRDARVGQEKKKERVWLFELSQPVHVLCTASPLLPDR